ncbi:MAG: hypothetical protein IJX17_05990 [Clostridia bacterium]|nr:hypothetical protein [Clostridia bacterium]
METPNNNSQEIPVVSSNDELIQKFDEFVKVNKLNLSPEKTFDFIARASYFLNNADSNKLTPYFNNSIGKEDYNGVPSSHRNLYTVPKKVNNYYEYGKGNLRPFCKFSGFDGKHGSRNDFQVYVDIENDLVYVTLYVTRLLIGKSGKVFGESDFSVQNYCIPNITTLIRGKSNDILNGKPNVMRFNEQYSDYEAYNDTLRKCVIMVSRVDMDNRHPNDFSDIPNMNKKKQTLAKEIFQEKADEPHLHFCYKDYILRHKEADSAALAISLKQLPNYLISLKTAQKYDDILTESFGLPFLEVRNKNLSFDHETIKQLTQGIRESYKNFSKSDKEIFKNSFTTQINLMAKKIKKELNEVEAQNFIKDSFFVYDVIIGQSDLNKSKDYEMIDSITVLNAQTEFLKSLSACKGGSSKLKNKFNIAINDLYTTINASIGNQKQLNKKKYNDYYNGTDYQENLEAGLEK